MVNPPVNVKVFIHPLMSLSRSNQKNQRANRLSINSPSSFLNQGTLPKDIYFSVFFFSTLTSAPEADISDFLLKFCFGIWRHSQ